MTEGRSIPAASHRGPDARRDPASHDDRHHNWIAVLLVVGAGFMSFVLVSMVAH